MFLIFQSCFSVFKGIFLMYVFFPNSQLCLFCEKSFKDKASLREHMRKKQHRKINPKNKEYDRFYIINYMVTLPSCLFINKLIKQGIPQYLPFGDVSNLYGGFPKMGPIAVGNLSKFIPCVTSP